MHNLQIFTHLTYIPCPHNHVVGGYRRAVPPVLLLLPGLAGSPKHGSSGDVGEYAYSSRHSPAKRPAEELMRSSSEDHAPAIMTKSPRPMLQ